MKLLPREPPQRPWYENCIGECECGARVHIEKGDKPLPESENIGANHFSWICPECNSFCWIKKPYQPLDLTPKPLYLKVKKLEKPKTLKWFNGLFRRRD